MGGVPPKMGAERGVWGQSPHLDGSLEITHFVTGSVMFFVVFPAFRHLYTPPKTPFFPTGPASFLGVLRVFPHILLILEHKIRCFVAISMVFPGKVDAPVFFTFTNPSIPD